MNEPANVDLRPFVLSNVACAAGRHCAGCGDRIPPEQGAESVSYCDPAGDERSHSWYHPACWDADPAGKPGHVRTTSVEPHPCRECAGTIVAGSEAVSAIYPGWERRWWHAGCWNPAREAG